MAHVYRGLKRGAAVFKLDLSSNELPVTRRSRQAGAGAAASTPSSMMMIIVIYCTFAEANRANLVYLSTR